MTSNPDHTSTPATRRQRLSDALIGGALDRGADGQLLTSRLDSLPATAHGAQLARSAAGQARLFESAVLWLGLRIRSRRQSAADAA